MRYSGILNARRQNGFLNDARKLILGLLALPVLCLAKPGAFEYEYVGPAVQSEGMHVWGSSPVIGPDGKVHLYVARWSVATQKNFNGW